MASISGKELYNLTASLYESAAETSVSGWQTTYERLSKVVSSGPGTIHFRHKNDDFFDPIADSNEPGFIERFNSIYWDLLPYKEQFLRLKTGDRFLRSRDCPDDQFVDSQVYQDHFKKLGIFEVLHYCLFDDERFTAGITFTRPRSKGRFTKAEQDFIDSLVPHIRRAARLHLGLREVNLSNRIMTEAWNRIEDGVVLVSKKGVVAFQNRAAEDILSSKNSLRVKRNGTLVCDSARESTKLRSVISRVFDTSGKSNDFGGRFTLDRPNGRQPLNIAITPFKENDRYARESEKFALVYISDPERSSTSSEEALRAGFGLTKAEARVAQLVASGHALGKVGEILDISPNTVRTHLKRIFSKTETNRQSSLVKLILSGPTTATSSLSAIISTLSLIWLTI
ncbi:MAG: helix-turn-helix transcriptional regulator [Pyrinomonadaceae bacterium]